MLHTAVLIIQPRLSAHGFISTAVVYVPMSDPPVIRWARVTRAVINDAVYLLNKNQIGMRNDLFSLTNPMVLLQILLSSECKQQ